MAEVASCGNQSFRTGVTFKRKGLIVRLMASEGFFLVYHKQLKRVP